MFLNMLNQAAIFQKGQHYRRQWLYGYILILRNIYHYPLRQVDRQFIAFLDLVSVAFNQRQTNIKRITVKNAGKTLGQDSIYFSVFNSLRSLFPG